MDKNKIIIGALIVIILAFLIGILVAMPNFSKTDTQLEIMGNDTVTEGSNLQIKLIDTNGTALVNQTVKITFTDKDNSTSDYSVVTNDEGVGELKLDKNVGNYTITAIYSGNDSYGICNATKKITIEKEVVEAQSTGSSSSGDHYGPVNVEKRYTTDSHGVYDNEHGVYITGQAEGLSKSELQYYEDLERRNGGRV